MPRVPPDFDVPDVPASRVAGLLAGRHSPALSREDFVHHGERAVVTLRGRPVAALISLGDLAALEEMELGERQPPRRRRATRRKRG